jgi:hypothetical protein
MTVLGNAEPGNRDSIPDKGKRFFFLRLRPDRLWGPPNIYSGVKRLRREADHLPPSSVNVKNTLGYTFTPPIRLNNFVLN